MTINPLKLYTPLLSSLRHVCLINKKQLSKCKVLKFLNYNKKNNSGRNKKGQLVLYTRSTVLKQRAIHRIVNFKFINPGIPGFINRIEYDPHRSSFINLIIFKNGICTYELATNGLTIGNSISFFYERQTEFNIFLKTGNTLLLKWFNQGSILYNLEINPTYGGVFLRAAGNYGLLVKKYININKALIRLRSTKFYICSLNNKATIGSVSNSFYRSIKLGKAGRNRWLGNKSHVRGVAMNPVDHPHGGGNGKKSKKKHPATSWGKMLHWRKTSRSKKNLFTII